MSDMPYIRARVSLLGHVSLGVVRLRYTDGGGIVLDDGRRYGPGAIYSIEPVPETIRPTPGEVQALEAAFDATIDEVDGRWCVATRFGIPARHSLFFAVAEAVGLILKAANTENRALRERLAKAEAGEAKPAAEAPKSVADATDAEIPF